MIPISLWNAFLYSCKIRNIDNSLTREEWEDLITQECEYCGSPPLKQIIRSKGSFLTYISGIDRINNNDGYHLDNCVPCCKYCNYAKGTMDLDDWLDHLELILKKQNRI